jgi:hypothetical protein
MQKVKKLILFFSEPQLGAPNRLWLKGYIDFWAERSVIWIKGPRAKLYPIEQSNSAPILEVYGPSRRQI